MAFEGAEVIAVALAAAALANGDPIVEVINGFQAGAASEDNFAEFACHVTTPDDEDRATEIAFDHRQYFSEATANELGNGYDGNGDLIAFTKKAKIATADLNELARIASAQDVQAYTTVDEVRDEQGGSTNEAGGTVAKPRVLFPVPPIGRFKITHGNFELGTEYMVFHLDDAEAVLSMNSIDTAAATHGTHNSRGGLINQARQAPGDYQSLYAETLASKDPTFKLAGHYDAFWTGHTIAGSLAPEAPEPSDTAAADAPPTPAEIAAAAHAASLNAAASVAAAAAATANSTAVCAVTVAAAVAATEAAAVAAAAAAAVAPSPTPRGRSGMAPAVLPMKGTLDSMIGDVPPAKKDKWGREYQQKRTRLMSCKTPQATKRMRNALRVAAQQIAIFDTCVLENELVRIEATPFHANIEYITQLCDERWSSESQRYRMTSVIEHLKDSVVARTINSETGKPTIIVDKEKVEMLELIGKAWAHINSLCVVIRGDDPIPSDTPPPHVDMELIASAQRVSIVLARHARVLSGMIEYNVDEALALVQGSLAFRGKLVQRITGKCGFRAKIIRYSNAPDLFGFCILEGHGPECNVIGKESNQKIPWSVKRKITELFDMGLSNRQVCSRYNKQVSHGSGLRNAIKGSGRVFLAADDVNNLRTIYRMASRSHVKEDTDGDTFLRENVKLPVEKRFVRAYKPHGVAAHETGEKAGFGFGDAHLLMLEEDDYLVVLMDKAMCLDTHIHGDVLYIQKTQCVSVKMDVQLIVGLVRGGPKQEARPVVYTLTNRDTDTTFECIFDVMQKTIQKLLGKVYKPKVVMTGVHSHAITGARAVFGPEVVEHLVCIHDSLAVVKARLGSDLALKRKLEPDERLALTSSIFTKFHLVTLTASKSEFMVNMRALLQNLIDNQLDRLLAYFVTFWLLRKDFPPASWALAYRSNAAAGTAFKNMSRHNVLVSSCVYPREHLAYNKNGGVSALFAHLLKTATSLEQRVSFTAAAVKKRKKQLQQAAESAQQIVRASGFSLNANKHARMSSASATASSSSAEASAASAEAQMFPMPSTTIRTDGMGGLSAYMDVVGGDVGENTDAPSLKGDAQNLAVVAQQLVTGLVKVTKINDEKTFMQDVMREARKHVVARVLTLRHKNYSTRSTSPTKRGPGARNGEAINIENPSTPFAGNSTNDNNAVRGIMETPQSAIGDGTASSSPPAYLAVAPALDDEMAARAARRKKSAPGFEMGTNTFVTAATSSAPKGPSRRVMSKTYTLLNLPGRLIQRMLEPGGVVVAEPLQEMRADLAGMGYHAVPKNARLTKVYVSGMGIGDVGAYVTMPTRSTLDQFLAERSNMGIHVVFTFKNPYAGDGLGDGWNRPTGEIFAI